MDDLKHGVMINQFVAAVGCMPNEAMEHLKNSGWQFESALSRYFQESGVSPPRHQHQMRPLTNTPATPPGFPEALLNFSKMQASEKPPQTVTSKSNFSVGQKKTEKFP